MYNIEKTLFKLLKKNKNHTKGLFILKIWKVESREIDR